MLNTQDPTGKEDKVLTMDFERHFIPPCSAASSELCVDGDYKEGLNVFFLFSHQYRLILK